MVETYVTNGMEQKYIGKVILEVSKCNDGNGQQKMEMDKGNKGNR